MEPLVSMFIGLRRRARSALPALGVLLLAAAVALDAAQPLGDEVFGVISVLLLVMVALHGWRRTSALEQSTWLDAELGCLLGVAALACIVHFNRDLGGPLYPLVFLVIAMVSAFGRPVASVIVTAAILGYEVLLWWLLDGGVDPQGIVPHAIFAVVFGLFNTVTLRLEVTRLRKASNNELAAEHQRIQEEARCYRLLRAPLGHDGDDDEERLLRSGVEGIQMSVLLSLQLLRDCVGVHTAMLLWLTDEGEQMRIMECVSHEAELFDGPFSARDGILGAVLTQGATLCVSDLKPSYVVPYYPEACPVKAVCAVPVFEHGSLRGALVVDRLEGNAFSAAEQNLIEQTAQFAGRAIENERVFVQLERTKVEQGKLYRAADRLGTAISEQEVVDAGVSSAREIAAVDFAAFTAFYPQRSTHQIRAVSGEDVESLHGGEFRDNTGLVSMALKNRHPLPYRGVYASHQMVFAPRLRPPDMPSLLVLPLIAHDEPLGTLVLGSHQAGAFTEAVRGLLVVLASHMAVSLSSARMVRKLEEQATTDGLTGVLNKRAMLDVAQQKIDASERFGRQLSVLVADIDLFKRVNDTYGHDVGDVVIKELAAICERNRRTTDAVARFGGEEFVIICEETDAEGAMLLAERIRADFAATKFHARGDALQGAELTCTCSVGVATYPSAGRDWPGLFKAADAALYASKRGGRDRATIFHPSHLNAA